MNTPPAASGTMSAWRCLRLGFQTECALFRQRKFRLSALAIVFVPALYAVFYVSSVWNPYGHLDHLPAALVNDDQGAVRDGRRLRLGDTVVEMLEQERPFHFRRYPSAEAAGAAIRRGDVYLAVVVPADFSERALHGRREDPAAIDLRVTEGANYTGAIIARRFGSELVHLVNERLNRERWARIVGGAADPAEPTLRAAVARLRDGGHQLRDGTRELSSGSLRLREALGDAATGAQRLADGTGAFADGAAALSDGMGRVAAGVQSIRERLPAPGQMQELAAGSSAAVNGSEKLAAGLGELVDGGRRLQHGAGQLRQGAARVPFFGRRLAAGAAQLEDGAGRLDAGLVTAAGGGRELHAGLQRIDGGVQPLADGLVRLGEGLQTMCGQLPTAEQRNRVATAASQVRAGTYELAAGLVRLRDGSRRLAEGGQGLDAGARELAGGLDRLDAGLAAGFDGADAGGLAAPVRLVVESAAPVPNNGTAYSPYFAALSLWVGVIMMTFVIHFRRLIEPLRAAPRWARWTAKAGLPWGLGILQATVVVAVLRWGFGIGFVHPGPVWTLAVLGSVTFVSVILMLMALLADAGRLLAVVLLILQLAAAGGIYPVELSGRFYETINPYLPFTALVTAFRATMFAAFDGAWAGCALHLAATAAGAVLVGMWLGRWKYVAPGAYGPAVDL